MKERWLRLYFGHNAEMKGEVTEVGSEIEGGRDTKGFTALILNAMEDILPWSGLHVLENIIKSQE